MARPLMAEYPTHTEMISLRCANGHEPMEERLVACPICGAALTEGEATVRSPAESPSVSSDLDLIAEALRKAKNPQANAALDALARVRVQAEAHQRALELAAIMARLVCVDDVPYVENSEGRRALDLAANELGHLLGLAEPEFDTVWAASSPSETAAGVEEGDTE